MAGKVIMVVILILVVAFGIFIYQVAAHPKSFGLPSWLGVNGSSSAFNFTLSSPHGAQGPQGLPSVPQVQPTSQTSPAQTVITSPASSSVPVIDPSQIPAGFTLAQLSPYFHQVRFENISAGSPIFMDRSFSTITSTQTRTSTLPAGRSRRRKAGNIFLKRWISTTRLGSRQRVIL